MHLFIEVFWRMATRLAWVPVDGDALTIKLSHHVHHIMREFAINIRSSELSQAWMRSKLNLV